MNRLEKIVKETGSKQAPEEFYIKVSAQGPYLVYGNPPIVQETFVPNKEGLPWEYCQGLKFDYTTKVAALCRCGASKKHPFCDGSHKEADWNPEETSDKRPILEDSKEYKGPNLVLSDNRKFCALARFCDSHGTAWKLAKKAQTEEEKELARHSAGYCPAGRLLLYDREKQEVYEPEFKPSIGVLEDPTLKVSGPLWVKGGIRIESADGESYEIRNRVTLCRCGKSRNKPFCDGAHVDKSRFALPQ
ncbi:CDGSH iron-sulfur domain-containing protein [Bacteroides sp. 224]|nr:CDGSH iron-sulfur domain-containing protein [Bacteroides sp. 224]